MGRKTRRYTMVESEAGDWFVIPVEELDNWWDEGCMAGDPPEYAKYVQRPSMVSFCAWKEIK